MNIKEIVAVSRVVISTGLLVTAGWMATHNSDGWLFFFFGGLFIYPNQINIDFSEDKDNEANKNITR